MNTATEAREAARRAELDGDVATALRAWQAVLRFSPDDAEAWLALADLHEERGDLARARACRERVGAPPPPDAPPEVPVAGPSDADLLRFVARFAGREGVHARMWHDKARGTGWSPVHQQLAPEHVLAHVAGSITLGSYLVRVDQTCAQIVLDLDISAAALRTAAGDARRLRELHERAARAGLELRAALDREGLPALFVDSGHKGRHLWLFLPRALPAELAWKAGRALAAAFAPADPALCLESFPRQGQVPAGGLGNLVKLPLGLHLRSGRRSSLLDADGLVVADPWPTLRELPTVALAQVEAWAARPETPRAAPGGPPVVPEVVAPTWTEADFETSRPVAALLDGCPVLRRIVEQVVHDRRLTRDAAVVTEHTLGHLPEGPHAVNWLRDQVPGFPADRMGAPHSGSPTSCARIRQRLPEVAREVGCACRFPDRAGRYAHPLRHLDDLPPEPPRAPQRSVEEVLETLARATARLHRLQAEVDGLRAEAMTALASVEDRRWRVPGGVWCVEEHDGQPELLWEPA